jgi:hypothetical protein
VNAALVRSLRSPDRVALAMAAMSGPLVTSLAMWTLGAGGGGTTSPVTGALLVIWIGLGLVQVAVDALPDAGLSAVGPAGSLLSSTAVYGLIALWMALARAVLVGIPRARTATVS